MNQPDNIKRERERSFSLFLSPTSSSGGCWEGACRARAGVGFSFPAGDVASVSATEWQQNDEEKLEHVVTIERDAGEEEESYTVDVYK